MSVGGPKDKGSKQSDDIEAGAWSSLAIFRRPWAHWRVLILETTSCCARRIWPLQRRSPLIILPCCLWKMRPSYFNRWSSARRRMRVSPWNAQWQGWFHYIVDRGDMPSEKRSRRTGDTMPWPGTATPSSRLLVIGSLKFRGATGRLGHSYQPLLAGNWGEANSWRAGLHFSISQSTPSSPSITSATPARVLPLFLLRAIIRPSVTIISKSPRLERLLSLKMGHL